MIYIYRNLHSRQGKPVEVTQALQKDVYLVFDAVVLPLGSPFMYQQEYLVLGKWNVITSMVFKGNIIQYVHFAKIYMKKSKIIENEFAGIDIFRKLAHCNSPFLAQFRIKYLLS